MKPSHGSSKNPFNKLIPAGVDPTTATRRVLYPNFLSNPAPKRIEERQVIKPTVTLQYHRRNIAKLISKEEKREKIPRLNKILKVQFLRINTNSDDSFTPRHER